MAIKIDKGIVLPDKAALRKIAEHLKSDPKSLKAFKKSPTKYLADIGLNVDVRRELLKNEPGGGRFAVANRGCRITCVFTACPCTNCCITLTL